MHRRAEADKATEQAELHRVSSMLAAGWGGLGAVSEPTPSHFFESRVVSYGSMPRLDFGDIKFSLADSVEVPAFLRTAGSDREPASLEAMARSVRDHLAQGEQIQGLAASLGTMTLHGDARKALDDAVQLGLSLKQAWLLLVHWTNTRTNGLADAELTTLLRPLLTAIDPVLAAAATKVFERHLGSYPIDDWALSRVQRLRRALGRSGT